MERINIRFKRWCAYAHACRCGMGMHHRNQQHTVAGIPAKPAPRPSDSTCISSGHELPSVMAISVQKLPYKHIRMHLDTDSTGNLLC